MRSTPFRAKSAMKIRNIKIRICIKSNHECKKENLWISADRVGCLLFMPVHCRAGDWAGRSDKVSQTESG